MGIRKIIF